MSFYECSDLSSHVEEAQKKPVHSTKKCTILYSLSFRLSEKVLLIDLNFFYLNVQFEN